MKKTSYFILLFLLLTTKAWATHYYISNSDGNNSNNGTDPAYAFKTPSAVTGHNFLKPGDEVSFKRGDTWVGKDAYWTLNSSGAENNPIVLDAYGEPQSKVVFGKLKYHDNDPLFIGSEIYKGGWTVYPNDSSGHTYQTNAKYLGDFLYLLSVDDNEVAYLKHQLDGFGGVTTASDVASAYMLSWSSHLVFLKLLDGSDPSAHTIRLGQYPKEQYDALIKIGDKTGSAPWVVAKNLHVRWSNGEAFRSQSQHVQFIDCWAEYNGKESFYFVRNGINPPENGADYNSCVRCTGRFSNSGGNGHGQNFTMESSYSWWIDCFAQYGGRAGFDFLDYNANTKVQYSGAIRCEADTNAQEWNAKGNFDAGFYSDGADHILIYSCKTHGAGTRNNSSITSGISLSSEHSSIRTPDELYVINTLSYSNKGDAITISINDNTDKMGKVYLYNDTFNIGQGIKDAYRTFGVYHFSSDGKLTIKNCIFNQNANAGAAIGSIGADNYLRMDSDYNVWSKSSEITKLFKVHDKSIGLSEWQSISGQDKHSVAANALLSNDKSADYDAHLSPDSPAIDLGTTSWYSTLPDWVKKAIGKPVPIDGSARKDGTPDDVNIHPDAGYHYTE